MKIRKVIALVLVMTLFLSLICVSSLADSDLKFFTDKNSVIQMVIPYGAGGGTDLVGRKLQAAMEKYLDRTIVVSNMPGAAGAIGAQFFSTQPADGFNIMFFPETLGLYPAMAQSDLTYDDFILVYACDFSPGTFVVDPSSPYQTLEALAEAAKANPEGIKMSVSGVGDAWYLCLALFEKFAGCKVTAVPYNSGTECALAAMKGEVDVGICGLIEAINFVHGGQLVDLGVFAPEDVEVKDIGTFTSVAKTYPEMAKWLPAGSFHSGYLPKDTPQEIVEAWIEAFKAACDGEEFTDYCESNGLIKLNLSYPESQQFGNTYASRFSWFLYDIGIAMREPTNIPRLAE